MKISRRDFLKYICASGAMLIAPFLVPFGKIFAIKKDTPTINHTMEQPELILPQRDPSHNVDLINSMLEYSENVRLGEGVFNITPSWQNPGSGLNFGLQIPKSNTTLEGSGIGKTILRAIQPDMTIISNLHYDTAPAAISGIRVANLTLDGNKSNNTPILDQSLIRFRKSVNVVYDGIEAINGAFVGIACAGISRFPDDGDGKNFTISNCISRNCNDNGFDIASNATITNCMAINNNAGGTTANLDFDGADPCLVDGFKSIGGTVGIHIGNPVRPSNNVVIKNDIQNPLQNAIVVEGTKGAMVLNTHIEMENSYTAIQISKGASVSKISNVHVLGAGTIDLSEDSSIIENNNVTSVAGPSVFGYYFESPNKNKPLHQGP